MRHAIRVCFPQEPKAILQLLVHTATQVPARLPHDFLPGRFRTEAEIPQNTPSDPVTFQDQAEQDMFGADGSIPGDLRFPGGKVERLPDTGSVWNPARRFAEWK